MNNSYLENRNIPELIRGLTELIDMLLDMDVKPIGSCGKMKVRDIVTKVECDD